VSAHPAPPQTFGPQEAPSGTQEPALRAFQATLRRRAAIVVIALVALPAGAIAYSLVAQKQYTATAKLLFRDPGFDQKLLGGQVLAPSADASREAATNLGLVSLDTVAARAAAAIRSRRLTASEIRDRVTVAGQGQSNVVAISATDAVPAFAKLLADTLARQYILFRRDADRAKISQAIGLVRGQLNGLPAQQRDGREGRSLRQQVEQLRVLAALQTGNAELVQPAERPRSPSSPNLVRNTILALILGLTIGLGLAWLLDRLDRRVHDHDDIEALLGRPVVGTIPESTSIRTDQGGELHLTGPEAEAFRSLRTNLRYYDIDRDIRSVLVTSSAPGDGKSTVARYLAATAAAAGVRVVLLEADLRRPTLNGLYPSLRRTGLSDVLTDQASLTAAITALPVVVAGAPTGMTLDVVTAGSLPPNPADLLESDRMRAVLEELHALYELVVVDSSPVTVVADSIPILGHVSGVLVVMREAKSTSAGARKLRDQLAHLGISPLGIVMNGTEPVALRDHYGYLGYAGPGANGASQSAEADIVSPRWPRLSRRKPRAANKG